MPKQVISIEKNWWSGQDEVVTRTKPTTEDAVGGALVLGALIYGSMKENAARAAEAQLRARLESLEKAYSNNEFETAFNLTERFINDSEIKSYSVFWFIRGEAAYNTGRFDVAIETYDRMLSKVKGEGDAAHKEKSHLQYRKGCIQLQKKDYVGASKCFSDALKEYPSNDDALNGRAVALRNLQDYSQSLTDLNEAIRLDPADYDHYQERALLYLDMEETDKALTDISRAITLNPKSSRSFSIRGWIYFEKKDDAPKALADYSQAIALNPNDIRGYQVRKSVYLMLGDTSNAEKDSQMVRLIEVENAKREAPMIVYDKYWQQSQAMLLEDFDKIYETGDLKKYSPSLLVFGITTSICLVLFACFLWIYSSGLGENSLLCFSPVALVIILYLLATEPDKMRKPKLARKYFDKIDTLLQDYPNFEKFHSIFVSKGGNSAVKESVQEATKVLFQPSGACYPVVEAETQRLLGK